MRLSTTTSRRQIARSGAPPSAITGDVRPAPLDVPLAAENPTQIFIGNEDDGPVTWPNQADSASVRALEALLWHLPNGEIVVRLVGDIPGDQQDE